MNKTELIKFFRLFQQNEEEDMPEFYVVLCLDNFMELLRFGCRRQLTKSERIGRRFHLMIENYLGKMPFLRLDVEFNFWFHF